MPILLATATLAFSLNFSATAQSLSATPAASDPSAGTSGLSTAPKPTLANFTGLPQGTTMSALEKKVGPTDGRGGSGVGYYWWHLADGSQVTLVCNDGSKIELINHTKDGVRTKLYPDAE